MGKRDVGTRGVVRMFQGSVESTHYHVTQYPITLHHLTQYPVTVFWPSSIC